MAKFCGKCGAKLDEKTGLCPKCDGTENASHEESNKKQGKRPQKKFDKRNKKREKRHQLTSRQRIKGRLIKIGAVFAVITVVIGGSLGLLKYLGLINIQYMMDLMQMEVIENNTTDGANKEDDGEDSYMVEAPDAGSYYSANSEIISEIDAKTSETVTSEKDTYSFFEGRGFIEQPITTEYSMDGVYSSSKNVSSDSEEKHPIYQTYYFSKAEELWTIFLINGMIMANPVSYNMQSNLDAQVIVSEKQTVISYDSTTNKFFETIPDKSALVVVSVDRIDATSLDNLTIGEIDNHVK